ncbi:MAG: zinc ribbon domain-containing protein [Treponema sp.]|nr:zinc ribbon domain-containing protein [Treponema sp.]
MKKSPRFFCDNCGAEVPLNSKNCPFCGRFFSSVRCPSCGYSADENHFKSGCPQCGYSAPMPDKKIYIPAKKQCFKLADSPFWLYILAAAAVAALLSVILFT